MNIEETTDWEPVANAPASNSVTGVVLIDGEERIYPIVSRNIRGGWLAQDVWTGEVIECELVRWHPLISGFNPVGLNQYLESASPPLSFLEESILERYRANN